MMIGTDSHTPNAGGLGMVAIGVGGADAVDVMAGFPFNVRFPKLIGVNLTGELNGWTAAEGRHPQGRRDPDGQGRHRRHRRVLRARGRVASLHRQGHDLQHGRRDRRDHLALRLRRQHARYLRATGRADIADAADAVADDLRADAEVYADPAEYFDEVIEIDLPTLAPLHQRPPHPRPRPPGLRGRRESPRPRAGRLEISAVADRLVHQLLLRGHHPRRLHRPPGRRRRASTAKTPLLVTPGSEQVRATIERDGLLADLEAIGATVLANACGPCIGQWAAPTSPRTRPTSSSTRYNRNFPKRNDGSAARPWRSSPPRTPSSRWPWPGPLDFDPLDRHAHQRRRRAGPPRRARRRRAARQGLRPRRRRLRRPARRRRRASTSGRRPDSDRLQLLEPFAAWDGNDFVDLPLLLKAKGKCTTDHISMAGPWLKYRGHLENISGNLFIGAVNAFTGEAGTGKDPLDGETRAYPDIASTYHEAGVRWVAVGDENYGEGSPRARRHGAPLPRRRGDPRPQLRPHPRDQPQEAGHAAADLRRPGRLRRDRRGRPHRHPRPGRPRPRQAGARARSSSPTARPVDFQADHTLNDEQIEWFQAGGALNIIRLPRPERRPGARRVGPGRRSVGPGRRAAAGAGSLASAVRLVALAGLGGGSRRVDGGHDPAGVGVGSSRLQVDRRADPDPDRRRVRQWRASGTRALRGQTCSVPHRPIGMTGDPGRRRPARAAPHRP